MKLLTVDKISATVDKYEVRIGDVTFHLNAYPDLSGYGFWATVSGYYDGTNGSVFSNHSMVNREDAVMGLTEKLNEYAHENFPEVKER